MIRPVILVLFTSIMCVVVLSDCPLETVLKILEKENVRSGTVDRNTDTTSELKMFGDKIDSVNEINIQILRILLREYGNQYAEYHANTNSGTATETTDEVPSADSIHQVNLVEKTKDTKINKYEANILPTIGYKNDSVNSTQQVNVLHKKDDKNETNAKNKTEPDTTVPTTKFEDEDNSVNEINIVQQLNKLLEKYEKQLKSTSDILENRMASLERFNVEFSELKTICACKVPDLRLSNCYNHSQSTDLLQKVQWTLLPGAAVEISAKGQELWVINRLQMIYRWNGSNWNQIAGSAVKIGASPDGWTWVVNGADNIYRFNVNRNSWDNIPGLLVQISAMSKNKALGVNRSNNIYLWENDAWKQLPGVATWVAIGDDDERWMIYNSIISRWNNKTNDWDLMPGASVNVDVQNSRRIIMTNASNQIYIWKNNNWQLLTGSGTRSTITDDHYYTVNNAQQIWIGE